MQMCVKAIDPEIQRFKKLRRQQNSLRNEIDNAVQVITARDAACPLTRISEPTRLLREVLAKLTPETADVPFQEMISRASKIVRMQLQQPGLGEPAQSTVDAVSLLIHQSDKGALDELRNGRACWLRAGHVRLSTDPKR